MTPFGLIEQDPAAARIREAATRNTLSHALLFTGSGSPEAVARYAAAALECTGEGSRPCGACPSCRKVLANIHPDVITVRDDQHKSISVDVIRDLRADAYIRPNEGRRKVYLFLDCALLTDQDQNVLLKIVEEGPPYAAFLFCAENSAAVLGTLRSRCVELKLRPAPQEGGGEQPGRRRRCAVSWQGTPRRGFRAYGAPGKEKDQPGGTLGAAGTQPGAVRGGAAAAVWV